MRTNVGLMRSAVHRVRRQQRLPFLAILRLRSERSLSIDSFRAHKFEAVPDGLMENPQPTRSHGSVSTRALRPDDLRVLLSRQQPAKGECNQKHGNPLRGRGSTYEMHSKMVAIQKSTHQDECFQAASDIPRRE